MLSFNYRPDSDRFIEQFQNVNVRETGLWVRWLWPDRVEREEIFREAEALAEAGFAGAEIGLHAMGKAWGTDGYWQGLIWAMEAAKEYGLQLDFFMTVGTLCLPLNVLPVDSDAAEKILYYYDTRVQGGKNIRISLGIPKQSSSTVNARLVAVTYNRIEKSADPDTFLSETDAGVLYADQMHLEKLQVNSPVTLETLLGADTLAVCGFHPETHKFDVDKLNAHGPLEITADLPDCGEYAVFAYWEVPSDKTFGGVTQYCCDHYSLLGTKAVTDCYDRAVERFPALGQGFREVGRAFFCDSLENNGNWTLKILDRFYELFGQDFTKYLYAVANGPWRVRPEMAPPPAEDVAGVVKGKPVEAGPKPPHYGLPFSPPDFSAGQPKYTSENIEMLRNSYYEAMTRCFIENHIHAYQAWADRYGMDIRYQSTYGQKMFMGEVSKEIDMAETESLAYRDEVDGYRAQAAAVHMAKNGSGILSSEQGENDEDQFHTTTWSGDFLWRSNRFYVSGGNQLVYHVFSYTKYDEPIVHGNGNMVWPGFRPQPNVGDNLQFNRPTMGYMEDYSKFIARTQLLLRTGEAKLDAAIYYHNYNNDRWDFDAFYHGDELEKAGYGYEFIDPSFFELENAIVKNGVFAPDGPGYRAFLFQNQETLPVAAAEKLLKYAKAGLPMVFAGCIPAKAAYAFESDETVQSIAGELLDLPNVCVVESADRWPAAMKALGVTPSLDPNGSAIMYAHRAAEDADYYFLYNQEKYFTREAMWMPLPDIDTTIALKGKPDRIPWLLNLWSGEIHPLDGYTEHDGTYRIPLRLRGNDTAAIALAGPDWNVSGTESVGPAERILPLENWALRVISHEPGERALSGEDLTDTRLVEYDLGVIGAAKPWTQMTMPDGISGETVSGVGIYETTAEWNGRSRILLDLGAVCDLYRLTVNGSSVPGCNPVNPVQEITKYLHAGTNSITVEVASNFFHAERSRNYLSTNWVERKPFTAWDFGILGQPVLKLFRQ